MTEIERAAVEQLDRLAGLWLEVEAADADLAGQEAELLRPVASRLELLRKGFAERRAEIVAAAEAVEAEVKQAVLGLGFNVRGDSLLAVWNKGRTSWNSDLLEGMALAIPEIAKARKQGQPSVSIRAAG